MTLIVVKNLLGAPVTCVCICCRIVYSVLFESWEIAGPYQSWWLFNGLLLVLQVLHIIWFYLIARIAIKAIFKGKVSLFVCGVKYNFSYAGEI